MEELKLRAWLTEDKVMLPVESISFLNGYMDVVLPPDRRVTKVKQETKIMQATGLKDVHGKDIYEGDLLATPFEEDSLFIMLLDTTVGVYTKSTLTGKLQFIGDFDNLEEVEELKAGIAESTEIKGNIYENKDLLGK